MEILKESYDQCGSGNMVSLVPNMGHGHGPAWSRPESYAFAKSIIEDGTLWCERLESGILKNQLFAKFKTDRVLERATLGTYKRFRIYRSSQMEKDRNSID